ncbi:MAG: hypothetical protein KDA21_14595, partial [Phycisphaerales bacterium]|nr:hypothetical protein [Phycisphaerales bacterium]
MRDHHVTAAMLVALLSGTALGADWSGVTGNWNDASQWAPMDVPDTAGESALLPDAMYTLTMNLSPTIDSLTIAGTGPVLNMPGAFTLSMLGDVDNDGLINMASTVTSADAVLRFATDAMITGSGMIIMNRPSNDTRITTDTGFTVTHGANHVIMGVGQITAQMVNDGIISASGASLELEGGAKTNNNLMEALSGGTLTLETAISQGPSGVIVARDGGQVLMLGSAVEVLGGELATEGTGFIQRQGGTTILEDVTNSGALDAHGASTLNVTGSGLTNNGVIRLNTNVSSANAILNFDQSGTLDGTGTVMMIRASNDSQVTTSPGQVLTHAATHTIEGNGLVLAALVNNGTVRANVTGSTLELEGNDKTNNASMLATNGGFLQIENITVTQSGTGDIRANNGTVLLSSTNSIINGRLTTQNGGEILRQGGTSNFSNVRLNGILNCHGATTVAVTNGLTNNGAINLNTNVSASDAVLLFDDSTTLGGTGEVVLVRQGNDSRIETAPAVTMTAGADQWIHGAGQINASLINNGLIEADLDTFTMLLAINDKINNATISARNNGRLEIGAIAITQDPGAMLIADNGIIDFTATATVTSGTLVTDNGGIIQRSPGLLTLDGVTLMGDIDVEGAGTIALINNDFINDGSVALNTNTSASDGILRFDSDLTIDGSGEIVLSRPFNDAQITSAAKVTGTIGASQTVRGMGTVFAEIVNNGLFTADSTIGSLRLDQNVKTNNSIMRAEPGCLLEIITTTIDQTGGGVISTDGGEVRLSNNSTIVGGDLISTSGGLFTRTAGTTILDGVTS